MLNKCQVNAIVNFIIISFPTRPFFLNFSVSTPLLVRCKAFQKLLHFEVANIFPISHFERKKIFIFEIGFAFISLNISPLILCLEQHFIIAIVNKLKDDNELFKRKQIQFFIFYEISSQFNFLNITTYFYCNIIFITCLTEAKVDDTSKCSNKISHG